MSDTRLLKTGIALAMMYEMIVTPRMIPIHEIQWIIVLEERWRVPRRTRTNMYFPGNCYELEDGC